MTFFQIKIFDILVALKKLSNNNPLILAANTNTSLQNSLNVNYFSISCGWMSSGSFEKNNTEMTKKYLKMKKKTYFPLKMIKTYAKYKALLHTMIV